MHIYNWITPLCVAQMADPKEASIPVLKIRKGHGFFWFVPDLFLFELLPVAQVCQEHRAGSEAEQCQYFKHHNSQLAHSESAVRLHCSRRFVVEKV